MSIGDAQIIRQRRERVLNGYRFSDCVPFYLGPRSPMLYVIQHGYNGVTRVEPESIVYCVIKLVELAHSDLDCLFTDGHAMSALSACYTKDRLLQIGEIVNYEDVYSERWNTDSDIDLKRRKEAELLVRGDVPPHLVCGYVVYNETAKRRLTDLGIKEAKVVVKPKYYF